MIIKNRTSEQPFAEKKYIDIEGGRMALTLFKRLRRTKLEGDCEFCPRAKKVKLEYLKN